MTLLVGHHLLAVMRRKQPWNCSPCHQSPQEPQGCHLCMFLLGNTALFISQFKLNSKLIFFNSEIRIKCCLCSFLGNHFSTSKWNRCWDGARIMCSNKICKYKYFWIQFCWSSFMFLSSIFHPYLNIQSWAHLTYEWLRGSELKYFK
jgi:hypothetical protein